MYINLPHTDTECSQCKGVNTDERVNTRYEEFIRCTQCGHKLYIKKAPSLTDMMNSPITTGLYNVKPDSKRTY